MQNNTGKQSDSLNPTPASDHIGDVTEMIAQHGTNVAPSTPSSVPLPHDELLTDEEKINITNDVCKKNNTSWDEAWELPKLKTELIAIECYKAVAKAQLLKCRQSEAAEIAELKSQLESCVNTLKERDNQLQKAEARIKELEDLNYKQSQMKCNRCPYNNPQEAAIRADQNKKIGETLQELFKKGVSSFKYKEGSYSEGSYYLTVPHDDFTALLAKLQKGESPE